MLYQLGRQANENAESQLPSGVSAMNNAPTMKATIPSAWLDGDVATSQSTMPTLIWAASGNPRGRDYWLFRGELYSSDVRLDSQGVRALIVERILKEQARLARAAATLERAAVPSDPRRTPIPPDVRSAVSRRDGGRCVNCGSDGDLESDHVIPVSMGGAHTMRNLQLLCASCNAAKGGDLV